MKQVINIAKIKKASSLSKNIKNTAKEVIGTCVSMGVTIEGMKPKEIIGMINTGKYDSEFS